MLTGKAEWTRDLLDVQRRMGLMRTALTVAAVVNSAPFREGEGLDPKKLFEDWTAEDDFEDGEYDWQIDDDGIARRVPKGINGGQQIEH